LMGYDTFDRSEYRFPDSWDWFLSFGVWSIPDSFPFQSGTNLLPKSIHHTFWWPTHKAIHNFIWPWARC
jgi:hypothetical protein